MTSLPIKRLLSFVLIVTLVALAACSKNKKKDNALTSNELRIPEHFKLIPADSPYVLASIKTVPYKMLGWKVEAQYASAVKTMRQGADEILKNYGSFEQAPTEDRVLVALVEELEGRESIADLKGLGITDDGHFSMYGIGIFPAIRIELGDGQLFEAMIQRVEARVGESMPTATVGTRTFRAYQEGDLMMPLIVTDNELLIGFTHPNFSEDFVGHLTGDKKPAKSMYDQNNLLAMQKEFGMLPYVSGYADFRGITSALLDQDSSSLITKSFVATGEEIPQLSEVCKTEYTKLVNDMPRAVFGYTELNKTSMKATMGLEVTSDLPDRLMAMKANSPAYGSDLHKKAMMAMTLGFGMDRSIEVLRKEAERVGSDPYQCEHLTGLNEAAENFYFSAQQVPPFARTLLGSTFVLQDLDIEFNLQGSPNPIRKINLDLMTVLNNSDPATFFSALKLFLPDLIGNLNPQPDLQPVAISMPAETMNQLPGMATPMLVMSEQALGVSVGANMQDVTKDYVGNVSETPSPIFSFTYDMQRFVDLFMEFMRASGSSPEDMAPIEAMLSNYKEIGPTTVSFDIKDKGFFIDVDAIMNAN